MLNELWRITSLSLINYRQLASTELRRESKIRHRYIQKLYSTEQQRISERKKNLTFNQPNIVTLSHGWIASHNVYRTVTPDLVTTFFFPGHTS
jgi:hypothetical protein